MSSVFFIGTNTMVILLVRKKYFPIDWMFGLIEY